MPEEEIKALKKKVKLIGKEISEIKRALSLVWTQSTSLGSIIDKEEWIWLKNFLQEEVDVLHDNCRRCGDATEKGENYCASCLTEDAN